MTVLHIDPESLAGRVVAHLKEHETETLHSDGIARLFDISPRVIHTQLGDLVAHQALKRTQDLEQGYIYRRGPQFKLVMLDGKSAPVVTPAHLAAALAPLPRSTAPRGPLPAPAALTTKTLTPETVGIRKGIPMPGGRHSRAMDWTVTLQRLTEVGDSTEPLPKRMRSVLARHVQEANKVEGEKASRFALRAIDDDHFGVWRTA